jgi:hypothetical protein
LEIKWILENDEVLKDEQGEMLYSVKQKVKQLCAPEKVPRASPRQWKSEGEMEMKRWESAGPSPLQTVVEVEEKKKKMAEEPQSRKRLKLWVH